MTKHAKAPDLPLDLAERLASWGDVDIIRPLTGGATQRVALVRCGQQYFVAKSTGWSAPALRWVARLQLVARRVGLFVPAYIPFSQGEFASGGWTLEPFVEGVSAKATDLSAIAPRLRSLHAHTRNWPARPHHPKAEAPQKWRGLAQSARQHWPKSAIHGDIGPRNLIRTTDGRLALIDWDEARWGPSCLDFSWQKYSNTPARTRLHLAEEAVQTWLTEPDHARPKARRLLLTHNGLRRTCHSNTRIASAVRS